MKKYAVLALVALTATLYPGCGYTSKTVLPKDIKTIYVDTVKNKIPIQEVYAYVPGLEIDITNAIINRLHRDGNLKVVKKEEADAILEPTLIQFEQEGLRFTSLESVEEYRLYIVLDVQLIDRATGDVIWHEPDFSGDAEYKVSTVRTINREEAAADAVQKIAKNVVDRIVEDW
ncbi:MAG TPA: LptE family protein [Verrucomicrobiae bacterium]|jgi:hypothetical protein|nr:LptE family protein [Verrucomicrobiae bacterium]